MHLDYQNFRKSLLTYDQGTTVEIAQIEDAVAVDAVAVFPYLYFGQNDPHHEKLEIERSARLARAFDRWGMVLMIEPRSAREKTHPDDKTDHDILSMYCRISAEIGADLVKCIFSGDIDALTKVINGCPAPVLVTGGSYSEEGQQGFYRAKGALEAGAAGIVFGRNIFESKDPGNALDELIQFVHYRTLS